MTTPPPSDPAPGHPAPTGARALSTRAWRTTIIAVSLVVLAVAADFALRSRWMKGRLGGGPPPLDGLAVRPPPGTIATAPGLRIAFLGDTGVGPKFRAVLELVKRYKADAVVHMGDALYVETAAQFWGAIDEILGHDFPYYLTQGNHDLPHWPALADHGFAHLKAGGTQTDAPSQLDPRLSLQFRGVSLVMLGQAPRRDDPQYIIDRFARDAHIWKVCAWHKNQNRLQVGGKADEMGWGVYESCRQMGALIANGHEHSYERTKTLVSMVEQRVDPGCRDPARVCVSPGAVPVFVSGLGGRNIRDQERCLPATYPYGCNGEWAFIYTSNQAANYGALFLTFHVDGDPHQGRGAFVTIDGRQVDTFQLRAQ
jgi:predicted phosphodiesterase